MSQLLQRSLQPVDANEPWREAGNTKAGISSLYFNFFVQKSLMEVF